MMQTADRATFERQANVSRETMNRLDRFEVLLRKWTPAINLVSNATLATLWTRHFLDSSQLFDIAEVTSGNWVDLGSGGGFPGLVISTIAAGVAPDLRVTLVESDMRKAAFLQTVIRELGLRAEVKPERIETLPPLQADVLSARALAALPVLLGYAERHLTAGGLAVFPKGSGWQAELEKARTHWAFDLEARTSMTDPAAVILKIKGVSRV